MKILVVNAGSSSIKYQLYDMTDSSVLAKGLCERIGIGGVIKHTVTGKEKWVKELEMPTHKEAIEAVISALLDPEHGCLNSISEIDAVGHRIVQGGPYFCESVLVDDTVIEDLSKCIDLAPVHTQPHLYGINGCRAAMPDIPQVLVFDTAFHQTMPEEAYLYALPYDMCQKYKIRRYGFHGTSHRYVSGRAIEFLGLDPDNSKIVTCHLGNGSSISAVKNGKVIDTSMGFTPLEGIIMGTRCGSIDPAIVPFIMEKEGFTPHEMQDFMNKQCGVAGFSKISSDMRDIEAELAKDNPDAMRICKMLAYGIKKYIGSYSAAMNGLDAIVFTAGVGENTALVRELSVKDLDYLGVKFDVKKNYDIWRIKEDTVLSLPDSKVKVACIPTNEELVIAQDTMEVLKNGTKYVRKYFD